MKSAFDVKKQNTSIDHKIVVALERISEAFRVLLWDEAKKTGLSPIQIQILVFLSFHSTSPNTPTYLAKEFNVTKATITDSVRVLLEKGLISKGPGPNDARSYTIILTEEGKKVSGDTSSFSNELLASVNPLPVDQKTEMLNSLYEVISTLNRKSVISVQRMCKNCRFLDEKGGSHYCQFLRKSLEKSDLRVDCPEHQPKQ